MAFSVCFSAVRYPLSAIFYFHFNIMPRIERLIYESVRFDVVLPPNVPDLPAFEALEQTDGLLVKGLEQLALDLVLAVDLPDKQLAVTKDNKLFGADLEQASFPKAVLCGADFRAAKLRHARFREADLRRAECGSCRGAVTFDSGAG